MHEILNIDTTGFNFSHKEYYLQNHTLEDQYIKNIIGIHEPLYVYDVEHWMPTVYPWLEQGETIIFKRINISQLKEGNRVLLMNNDKKFVIPRHVTRKGSKLVYSEPNSDSSPLGLNSKKYELLGLIVTSDKYKLIDGSIKIYIGLVQDKSVL